MSFAFGPGTADPTVTIARRSGRIAIHPLLTSAPDAQSSAVLSASLPAFVSLVSRSFDAYLSLRTSSAASSSFAMQEFSATEALQEFRQALVSAQWHPSCSNTPEVKLIWNIADCLLHIVGLFLLVPGSQALPFAPLWLDWLSEHFSEPAAGVGSSEETSATAATSPENPHLRALFRGQFEQLAVFLEQTHPRDDAVLFLADVVREYPLSSASVSMHEYIQQHRQWSARLARLPPTQSQVATQILSVMLGDRAVTAQLALDWTEQLTARCLFQHPAMHVGDAARLVRDVLSEQRKDRAADEDEDDILYSIGSLFVMVLEGDVAGAVESLQKATAANRHAAAAVWPCVHLLLVLQSANCISRMSFDRLYQPLVRHLVLQMAASRSLWRIALEYARLDCPDMVNVLVERVIEPSSELDARRWDKIVGGSVFAQRFAKEHLRCGRLASMVGVYATAAQLSASGVDWSECPAAEWALMQGRLEAPLAEPFVLEDGKPAVETWLDLVAGLKRGSSSCVVGQRGDRVLGAVARVVRSGQAPQEMVLPLMAEAFRGLSLSEMVPGPTVMADLLVCLDALEQCQALEEAQHRPASQGLKEAMVLREQLAGMLAHAVVLEASGSIASAHAEVP